MASKIRLSIFATMVAVVLVSAALAASSISFYIDGSPVDNDEVFDFDNQNVSVSVVADGYSGDPATGTLYVTYGSENISKTITYGNDKYSTPSEDPVDLTAVEGDDLVFTAVVNGTTIIEHSVSLNPTSPSVSEFKISGTDIISQKIIETQSPKFKVTATDANNIGSVTAIIKKAITGEGWTQTWNGSLLLTADDVYSTAAIEFSGGSEGSYTIVVTANDVYGNSKVYTSNFTVYEVLGTSSNIGDKFTGAGSFSLVKPENVVAYGIDVPYSFGFDAGAFSVTGVSVTFGDSSALTIVSDAGIDVYEDDIDFVSEVADAFKFTFTGKQGKVCFDGASSAEADKQTILYCSGTDLVNCESDDWTTHAIASECTPYNMNLDSYYALATCESANWCEGNCYKTAQAATDACSSGSGDDGGSSESSTTTKKFVPDAKSPGIKLTGSAVEDINETNGTAINATGAGGFLTGLVGYAVGNKKTAIPIGAGAVVLLGLIVFIASRKHHISKKGKGDDKPSINELAGEHGMQKPANPKDAKKLKDFVDVALMMDHDSGKLMHALKYRGWDPKTVDKIFAEAGFKAAKETKGKAS